MSPTDVAYLKWDDSWPRDVLYDLVNRYQEPHRFYHNMTHLENMFKDFDRCVDKLQNPDAVILAIYFHDAVYDPTRHSSEFRNSNEFHSRNLFYDNFREFFDDEDHPMYCIDESVDRLIESTFRHVLPKYDRIYWNDLRYFLDMDLGILAADENDFLEYEANIRKEYSYASDDVYCPRRVHLLRKFLRKKKIFYTDLHDEYAARRNLETLIKILSK